MSGGHGALPNLIVVGAMKCGTTALHSDLDRHPQIAMSDPKELNFFFGPAVGPADGWTGGNRWRGTRWYAAHFPADAPVRGESSPGYTSPSHPRVAERMAALVPDVRLVYLVRDPVARAVSQWLHHHHEGAEPRPLEEALLDPASQYLARSRYNARLAPFLERFPRERIAVVASEELSSRPRATLRRLYAHAGVDDEFWSRDLNRHGQRPAAATVELDSRLRARLTAALADDACRLRELVGRDFPWWGV